MLGENGRTILQVTTRAGLEEKRHKHSHLQASTGFLIAPVVRRLQQHSDCFRPSRLVKSWVRSKVVHQFLKIICVMSRDLEILHCGH